MRVEIDPAVLSGRSATAVAERLAAHLEELLPGRETLTVVAGGPGDVVVAPADVSGLPAPQAATVMLTAVLATLATTAPDDIEAHSREVSETGVILDNLGPDQVLVLYTPLGVDGNADEANTVDERLTAAGAEVIDTSGWTWTVEL